MRWTEQHVGGILADLADEDYFACQALFRITRVEFTKNVPTLAVSLTSRPVLYVNKEFLDEQAVSEDDVKAVLMHEFLHVVLQHTSRYEQSDPLLNIALDAIINSIIHRTYGHRFSDFFKRIYGTEGMEVLLRPADSQTLVVPWKNLHDLVYTGKLAADDLYELLFSTNVVEMLLIGNHGSISTEISEENRRILGKILEKMDGTRIWDRDTKPGKSDLELLEMQRIKRRNLAQWKRETRRLLEQCLLPDKSRTEDGSHPLLLPFLNTGDRRAFAQLRGSGFLPFSTHATIRSIPTETVTVYLDVSGSMSPEIDHLLTLLSDLRSSIRKPLWVFSNIVERAVFRNGSIEYKSTGGTSISSVFEHIRQNRFRRSLIVTDGYVEAISDDMLEGVSIEGLRVLISANGQGAAFQQKNIRYYQLKQLNV
jgi:hypothetical protein